MNPALPTIRFTTEPYDGTTYTCAKAAIRAARVLALTRTPDDPPVRVIKHSVFDDRTDNLIIWSTDHTEAHQ